MSEKITENRRIKMRAAAAGAISLAALTVGSSAMDSPESPPKESGLYALSRQLNVASLAGPVVVNWGACPGGTNTQLLAPDMRVAAFIFPKTVHSVSQDAPTIFINTATRYLDETNGKTVAWCGKAIAAKGEGSSPPAGSVVVVPNTSIACASNVKPSAPPPPLVDKFCPSAHEYNPNGGPVLTLSPPSVVGQPA